MMTDGSLSREAMLEALRDIRLPAEAAGGATAQLAATIALAGIAALCVAGIMRLMSRGAKRKTAPTLDQILEEIAEKPLDAQRVALLHLLKARAPARFEALRATLYRPGAGPGLADLVMEVRAHD